MPNRLYLILLLALLVLTACADTPRAPASASATPAVATPNAAELPDVLLVYTREGGIAGFCDTLTVRAEDARWESCTGKMTIIPLEAAVQAQLVGLAQSYGADEIVTEDNPGGPDNMKQAIQFHGVGPAALDGEATDALRLLADDLLIQAMAAP